MRFAIKFAINAVLLGGIATSSFADSGRYQVRKWTHFGVRPLAMGNAFVAVADDFNALFYNPAGLARLNDWDGEFLNPYFEVSDNTVTFLQDLTTLASGDSTGNKAVIEIIEKNAGKNHHLALGLTPHLIFPGFGFGIGAEFDASLSFTRTPSAFLNTGPRIVMPFAFAMNFLEDRLSVGASLKFRFQLGVNNEFSIDSLEALSGGDLDQYVESGYGYGTDIGILFTPMKTMEPTLGISVTDFGGTSFEVVEVTGSSNTAPDRILPSVNVGLSAKPMQSKGMYILTAIDMNSINQPYDFSKKLNLGVELGLGDILKIQSGLHQGYLSGGMELDVGLLAVRFATYAEELGTVAGKTQDRRYMIQMKLLI